jgi:hypothetical protein
MIGTYEFLDDRLTIIDPSIMSIDEDNMIINNTDKTINVSVVLIDLSGTKVSPLMAFCDMPRESSTWDDCDLLAIVTKRLEEHKITE